MANEFIIKINTDRNGQELALDNMTLEAADALKVFIDALTGVARIHIENTDNNTSNGADIRFSLRNGCVETALLYPESETEMDSDLEEAVEGKSYNSELVALLRNVQGKIRANGLGYSVIHKVKDKEPVDLTEKFKSKDFSIKRGVRKEWNDQIIFVNGHVYESGGKVIANIHVNSPQGDFKIDCTRNQASRFELYNKVYYLSILKKWKPGQKPNYGLLDIYSDDSVFSNYKAFYESIDNDSLERFDIIYNKLVESVESGGVENGEVIKLMKLFNYSQSDRGMLRTILIALKPIKSHERISGMYKSLADILRAGSTHKIV